MSKYIDVEKITQGLLNNPYHNYVRIFLNGVEPEDVAPVVKGRWIYPSDVVGFGRCSCCNSLWGESLVDNIFFRYCPRCGALLREETEKSIEKEKFYDDTRNVAM